MKSGKIKTGIFISFLSIFGILAGIFFAILFPRPFVQFIPEQITNPFSDEKLFFLVLGIDNAGEAGSDRTDAIMLAGLNTSDGNFELVSIPRDLIVTDPENPPEKIKINSLYKSEGIMQLEKKIEEIMGIELERYVIVDYNLFEYLGNLVGPVDIMVEEAMDYEDNQQNLSIHFERGHHQMNGEDLLKYIRFRNDSMGDLGRLERQKKVVMNLFSSLKNSLSIEFVEKEFNKLLEQMHTDFTVQDIIFIFLKLGSLDKMTFFSYPYSIAADGSLYSNQSELEKLKNAFSDFEEMPPVKTKKSVCIINCTTQTPRVFSIVSYNKIHQSDIPYFLLDSQLASEIYSSKISKNTIMTLNGNKEESEALKVKLSELYEKEFDILDATQNENLEFYYSVINHYLKQGLFYPTPVEAFVFIKEQ